MSNCLVLIDVQNGFISPKTNYVVDRIKGLIRNNKSMFDRVVATQFINHEGSPYIDLMGWKGLMDEESIKLHPFVVQIAEKIFKKDIYSCFTNEFNEFLEENHIDKLFLCGIDTDCCVLKSATDCFEKHLDFEVLLNYCASNGGEASHDAAELVMRRTIGQKLINKEM